MTKIHSVKGGGGLKLHVREWGNAEGAPILMIHGWSQNHMSWQQQVQSSLAQEFRLVAFDLRGHGMSEAPLAAENYNNSQLWADDIAAIIEQLELDRPILVGWSYGSFVACDYLRAYGQSAIAGINYVAAAVTLEEAAFGTLIGPGFMNNAEAAADPDLPTNIMALRNFLNDCLVTPIAQQDFEVALAYNVAVPYQIRANLSAREINSDAILAAMTVPVLVTHGRQDIVVLPAMAEHILDICPTAKASWYEGVGHMPFMENPERFNQELAAFRRQVE